MACLRKYGSLKVDSGNTKIPSRINGRLVYDSVSRKQFNEVVSMRNQYKVLFEDLLKKFNDQMNEDYELKNIVKDNQSKIDELCRSNAAKDNEISKLKQELAAKNEENSKLVHKIDHYEQIFENHEQEIFQLHETNIGKDLRIGELNVAIESKNQENSQLIKNNLYYKEMSEKNELEIFELNEMNIEKECQISLLKAQLAAHRKQIAEMAKEKDEIQVEVLSLEKECENIKQPFDCALQDIGAQFETNNQLQSANLVYQTEINDRNATIQSLKSSICSKDEKIKSQIFENKQLWNVIKILQEIDDNQIKEISQLKEENMNLESQVIELEKITKVLDDENFNMSDSFNVVFRIITKAREAISSQTFFRRIFNKNTPLILKYLENIEDITTLYQ